MKAASDISQLVAERLRESIEVKQAILKDNGVMEMIQAIAQVCVQTLRAGGKLLFFGNGGSAADAQHLAAELVIRYHLDRPAIAAIALNTDTSALTAGANDMGFECIFARQIEALGRPGDVAVGISTSGRSPNVLAALTAARKRGLATTALTGAARELT